MDDDEVTRPGANGWTSQHLTRPTVAVARYLRVDLTLPDGGVIEFGVEDVGRNAAEDENVMHHVLAHACEHIGDAKQIAERIELYMSLMSGRYWFAEVWTPGRGAGAEGVARYQIGGFRP